MYGICVYIYLFTMQYSLSKRLLAEVLGTFTLVFVGVGTALISGDKVGLLGIGLAFGMAVMMMAYTIGSVSGGHFNPAISLAMMLHKKLSTTDFIPYIVAQVIGGVLAVFAVCVLLGDNSTAAIAAGFASNGYDTLSPMKYNLTSVAVAETLATFLFATVVLGTTNKSFPSSLGGVVVGLTLAFLIITIGPISNASLNPARSLVTAVVAPQYLSQLWVFVVFPLIGGALAALVHKAFCDDTCACSGCDDKNCCCQSAKSCPTK